MVPRSQNVRYQCANVGFLALKLPSHSSIIHAHCLSPSNYHPPSVSRCCLPTGSLSSASPYALAASASPYHRPIPPSPPRATPLSSVVSLRSVMSVESVPVALPTSLITTTTTATTSYRPGHLLENNIHKVEPRVVTIDSFYFLLFSR